MLVKVFRAQDWDKREIDTKIIDTSPGAVKWVDNVGLNRGYIPKPYYVLQCYIDYETAVELDLASGTHSLIARSAKIFLYKKDNMALEYQEGYKYLCDIAGPKPKRYTGVPQGQPPCTKKILQELDGGKLVYEDLRKRVLDSGYEVTTFRGAMKALIKTGRIERRATSKNLQKDIIEAIPKA